eukprot:Skav203980  [mRNA]  locus=scaffold94:839062:840225:- [translate_table: standard]
MIAKLTWILCYIVALCASDVDVILRIDTTSASSKLVVSQKDTGCTVQTERQDVTCTPKDDGSDLGQVPATYASAVINCKNMNTSAYDSLTFEIPLYCAKFTFTQHMQKGSDKVRFVDKMEILPGSIANITCVFFMQTIVKHNLAGFTFPQYFPITGKKGEDVGFKFWGMPSVRVRAANLAEGDMDKCLELLNGQFAWGFGLRKSNQNVHELYFTTQKHSPNFHRVGFQINRSDVSVTKTVKDVALKNLEPKITQAGCSTASGNFAHLVKLKTFEPPAVDQGAKKHEENLEMSVDATQLPRGIKELDITLGYWFLAKTRQVQLKLPVADPIIDEPTEKPKEVEKSGSDAGLLAFLLTSAAGAVLAVAFFFYRRHQRIQDHEREVFARR